MGNGKSIHKAWSFLKTIKKPDRKFWVKIIIKERTPNEKKNRLRHRKVWIYRMSFEKSRIRRLNRRRILNENKKPKKTESITLQHNKSIKKGDKTMWIGWKRWRWWRREVVGIS